MQLGRGVKYTTGILESALPRRASGKSRACPTSACSPRFRGATLAFVFYLLDKS